MVSHQKLKDFRNARPDVPKKIAMEVVATLRGWHCYTYDDNTVCVVAAMSLGYARVAWLLEGLD